MRSIHEYIYSEKSDNIYYNKFPSANKNPDTAIIFLHGIVGSRRSWGKEYNSLAKFGTLYFLDLLGYGFSHKPSIDYTLEIHIDTIKKFIEKEVSEKNILFIGHSLGGVIALGYTGKYPERVKKTIILSLPYYQSEKEARKFVTNVSRFTFIFNDSLATKITCTLLCSVFGIITRQISPLLMRDLPRQVAQDIHRHSYQSYISTLTNVIYKQNLTNIQIGNIQEKLLLIHGRKDKVVPVQNIRYLAQNYNIPLQVIEDATHRFPLYQSSHAIEAVKHIFTSPEYS